MAEAGFPWHSQPRDEEPPTAAAKGVDAVQFNADPQGSPLDNTTLHNSIHQGGSVPKQHHSQGKHRHSLHKGSYTARQLAKATEDIRSLREGPGQLPVRTIPAWVRDAEEDDLNDTAFAIPDTPNAALVAHHNHSPSTLQRPLLSGKDHIRQGYPTSSGHIRPDRTSRWVTFGRSSVYPRENFTGEKVDTEWLNHNFTDYSKDWLADHNEDDIEDGSSRYHAFRKKRKAWYQRSQFTILRNPFIPLIFRLLVFSFAIVAIGLGGSIYHETNKIIACIDSKDRDSHCRDLVGTGPADYYQDPSALMAIIVDVIAVIYTVYITYDEYFSKPLGLRSARAKVRLVLLDLFFIVFQAANLSLSFESLTVDEGACQSGDTPRTFSKFENVCDRAEALSSVLLVSLIAWMLTFSVSVVRLVERINQR